MDSSVFFAGEHSSRRCENVDTRKGAISSGHVAATECPQRNFREGFDGNQMRCSCESFHGMLPNMQDSRSEAALYAAGRVQRAPVRLTCSCSGQKPEPFYDHDHRERTSEKRCCHGMAGSSTSESNQAGYLHSVCDPNCLGSAGRSGGSGFAKCGFEKASTSSRNSSFVNSFEFQRNSLAVGSMSHFPSTPTEVETRNSSLHTGSIASSSFHSQTKATKSQIMLYGWFLMKPLRENYSTNSSTFSSVAIGGYRCPRMEEKYFVGTANVVQRLERWKLRTSDGLEVGLMGVINIEKSVANGFSPSLVEFFTIGFPSAWVYMLLNMQTGASKGSSSGMPSPSGSPTDSAEPTGLVRNPFKGCRGTSISLLPVPNPVQSILQSSLFSAAPDLETKLATLRRYCTAAATPLHDGVSSDTNPAPQAHFGHEQAGASKDGDQTCLEANLAKVAPHPEEPSLCGDCSPSILEGVVARDPGEDPEISSQAQIPTHTDDVNVEDGRDDSRGPSIAAGSIADEVHVEVHNRGAATCDCEKDAAEVGAMAPDDVPCTPLLQTRERVRSDTETPVADGSLIEPMVDPESPLQPVETRKLSSAPPRKMVTSPVTVSVADPGRAVQTRARRKRLRSESVSPLAGIPVVGVEPISFPVTDPSGTAKTLHKRKRQRESLSPVADTPVSEPITVAVLDPVAIVKTMDRRKRRGESHSSLTDIPLAEPISVSGPNPVGAIKARDRRKSPRMESLSPVPDIPSLEQVVDLACSFPSSEGQVSTLPITVPVPDHIGIVTRDTRKTRGESHSPVPDIPVAAPITGSGPNPVSTIKTRSIRKSLRSESQSPVADIRSLEQGVDPVCSFPSGGRPITIAVPDPIVRTRDRRKRLAESLAPLADVPVVEPITGSGPNPVGAIKTRDRRKSPRSESQSPVADIPSLEKVVDPACSFPHSDHQVEITVAVPDPMGIVKTRDRRKRPGESLSPLADIPVVEQINCSGPHPVGTIKTRDRRTSPRSGSQSPVTDIPLLQKVVDPACSFPSSDCEVGTSSDASEAKGDAELDDELVKGDTAQRDDLDVEVNVSCKDTTVVRGHTRRKQYKISRNYYPRGKKKPSAKRACEKGRPRSDRSTPAFQTPKEEPIVLTDESQVAEVVTEAPKRKVGRYPTSTKSNKVASSLVLPKRSPENKRGRQAKKSHQIVPPPLPPPRVADKSKVTEAFGLKRSLHGRLLVPPLATWRSQSIKYDTDGSIIAISDGFSGSDDENCTGCYNFKPPADKGARTMQRRLCKAADKGSRKS